MESPFIEVEDVIARWRDGKLPSEGVIEHAILDTADFLNSMGGSEEVINNRVTRGEITETSVKRILATSVIQTLSNPQNSRINYWSEGITGFANQAQTLSANSRQEIPLISAANLSTLIGRRVTARIAFMHPQGNSPDGW